MKKTIFTFFACAMAFTMTANAKDTGYYQFIDNKTVLNLSESAEKEVEQDRIKATLRIEEESKINTTLQNRINEKMTYAVSIAKKYTDVKVSTGAYRVNQRWNAALKKNDGWTGSQEIILDSANKELILDVAQKLQAQGFNISGINYYLSREKAASFRTALINEALKRVQDRAKSVATQLGASTFHIGSIDVSNQQVTRPQMRHNMISEMAMDSKSMAAPVVEGSEERVAVSIRVAVILDLAQ
ncbi:MAG: putative secreted protein [Alphaproteobacteria bacterium]|jgi:predicted secreted protein